MCQDIANRIIERDELAIRRRSEASKYTVTLAFELMFNAEEDGLLPLQPPVTVNRLFGLLWSPLDGAVRIIPDNDGTKTFSISHTGAKLWGDKLVTDVLKELTNTIPRINTIHHSYGTITTMTMSNKGGDVFSVTTDYDLALKTNLHELMSIYFAMEF